MQKNIQLFPFGNKPHLRVTVSFYKMSLKKIFLLLLTQLNLFIRALNADTNLFHVKPYMNTDKRCFTDRSQMEMTVFPLDNA